MQLTYPNYIFQTEAWADFWVETNGPNHLYYWFEDILEGQKISCIIYEYPWHLEQRIRYLPRFPGLNFNQSIAPELLNKLSLKLLQKIVLDSKEKGIAFLKIDFEDQLANTLEVETDQKLLDFFQANFKNLKIKTKTKKFQWNQTIILDLDSIIKERVNIISAIQDEEVIYSKLRQFLDSSKDFWQTTNNNVRRYTKKVLTGQWEISIIKDDANFESFWQVYNQTKDRQQFHIHNKKYFQKLYNQHESRIIILKNQNEVVAAWFGLVSDNTLTYLYGGNTQYSLENYGQYLLHLVAVNLAFEENLRFYDLGGFDPDHGYGRFKENYKGVRRIFPGPIDIIFKPFKVKLIDILSGLRNIF
ncbi:MAG: GNAT family N-acetyltransferase [bacterium]